jgi:hypothetical protein
MMFLPGILITGGGWDVAFKTPLRGSRLSGRSENARKIFAADTDSNQSRQRDANYRPETDGDEVGWHTQGFGSEEFPCNPNPIAVRNNLNHVCFPVEVLKCCPRISNDQAPGD